MKCKDSERIQYFNGFRFVQGTDRRYFKCYQLNMGMHRYVWEYYNGPIPKGYVIHHKDGNKANNDISNLECIPRGTHGKLHGAQLTKEEREWRRNNVNTKARPKAVEWHKSQKGREWHKKQVSYRKDNRREIVNICQQCEKQFITYATHSKKFCSGACAQKYRRQHRLNDVEKICPVCGKTFSTDKYRPSVTCGHSCADRLRWQEGGVFVDKKRKGN